MLGVVLVEGSGDGRFGFGLALRLRLACGACSRCSCGDGSDTCAGMVRDRLPEGVEESRGTECIGEGDTEDLV
jgi:hypothetical protein